MWQWHAMLNLPALLTTSWQGELIAVCHRGLLAHLQQPRKSRLGASAQVKSFVTLSVRWGVQLSRYASRIRSYLMVTLVRASAVYSWQQSTQFRVA